MLTLLTHACRNDSVTHTHEAPIVPSTSTYNVQARARVNQDTHHRADGALHSQHGDAAFPMLQ
ncbi:expressed unknown protein [Ectocarpus siliculosus]|uniref:Uncharacterized protein n=1 Tax=Ectocarpus siliculosus TaxID=2880 RepID=D7FSL0_ECTSI|nr:expressed unknown protein [Ectocarpus siliculosus]|eukprot:CBJ31151.1 expressed unknown protein [Ectocarpus siliculosus]